MMDSDSNKGPPEQLQPSTAPAKSSTNVPPPLASFTTTTTTATTTTTNTASTTATVETEETATATKRAEDSFQGLKVGGKIMVTEIEASSLPSEAGKGNSKGLASESQGMAAAEVEGGARSTKMMVSQVATTHDGEAEGVMRSRGQEVASDAGRRVHLPPIPTSAVQFQADWRNVKRDRLVLTQYFKVRVSQCIHTTRVKVQR